MTSVLLFPLLVACRGCGEVPAVPEPAPVSSGWVHGAQTWYCGAEPSEAKAPEGAPAPTRDIVVKVKPTEDAMGALYAFRENNRVYMGAMTRFHEVGERAAEFETANNQRQKGTAKFSFSADFKTLTVEWQVGVSAGVRTTTLSAVADPAACPAGSLLK